MNEHTTKQIAEYLGTRTATISENIRKGNLKAKYKVLLNERPKWYVSHKEFLRFCDWFTSSEKYANCGLSYKKTPNIDEFDLAPEKYNSYVSLKIQRNKSILEAKYINRMRYKNIALYFNLTISSISQIILMNDDTDFAKQLMKMSDVFKL